jgi:hypothetical protein
MDEWRIGKDLEGNGSLIKVLARNLPGGNKENHENSQQSRCPGRNSKRDPSEYKSVALSLRPTRSLHPFLACFPYFERIKVGLCDVHAVCVSVYPPYPLLNTWTNLYETRYVIKTPEPISAAYFINSSHQSVFLYVYHPIVTRQQVDKNVNAEIKYTRNSRRLFGSDVFYVVGVVPKESRRLILPRTSRMICCQRWEIMWRKLSLPKR